MLIHTQTGLPWSADEPINGVRYPLNIETLWTDDELATVGLARPAPLPELEPEPAPEA